MEDNSASQQIDDIIKTYGGWKGEILSRLRAVIQQTDPDVVEEVKWKMRTRPEGLPVWSHDGILCIAETWKNDIKLIFFKGAQMKDPKKLFNARLNSSKDRAVELREGDTIDEPGLKDLILQAVELNKSKKSKE
jgi:hypothetical protein